MKTFPTFRTLTLGTAKPKLKGIEISLYVKEMLKKITYQKKKEIIDLVVVKVSDMSIDATYPTTAQIYSWAKQNGLELCPPETGPRLRLAYDHQPIGDYLVIGMEPITGSDGDPRVFGVYRGGGGGRWLGYYWDVPDREWDSDDRFVFRKLALGAEKLESGTLNLGALDLIYEIEERLEKLKNLI